MPPQVTLIGDSIRMGYTPAVCAELRGLAEVSSPEANGGTSRNLLASFDEWLPTDRARPEVVHLNCGLHDLARDRDRAGEPRVVLDEYESNVARLFAAIRERSGAAIIWATITPVNQERHSAVKGFDRYERDVDAYNAAALRAARAAGVAVNDLHAFVTGAGRDRLLTTDGVHFKPEGSVMLGQVVARMIAAKFNSGA